MSDHRIYSGNSVQLTAIDFTDISTPEELEQKLASAMDQYSSSPVTIILTDIMGGTPYMKAAALSVSRPGVRVISGANAPLLLDLVIKNMADTEANDADELAETLIATGREALTIFRMEAPVNDEPEDGDGI